MISVIENKEEWNAVLQKVDTYDIYHTYEYHQISKKNGEKPILITYEKQDCLVAIPLIVKAIRDTAHNDATSAYGYSGPISKNISEDFDHDKFSLELKEFLKQRAVASVFSRLNPYIPNQSTVLQNSGNIEKLGNLINIDLTLDLESQRRAYNPRLRTYINKCRKKYIIKEAENEEQIKKLVSIYYENMLRVNANDRYFFPGSYFLSLWKSTDFKTKFLLAYDAASQELAGGAIFTIVNDIIHYHLSGVKKEYLKLNPIKLLIDDMRVSGTHGDFKYFNLGGVLAITVTAYFVLNPVFQKTSKTSRFGNSS